MDLDKLKAVAGKYGKVSKKGLYSGATIGRFSGGYLGLKAGETALPDAEILELYPQIDPGQFGPEEQALYAAVVGGYFAGGIGLAKAVTRYQELKESDIEYTRPFLKPFETLEDTREYLEEGEEKDISEGLENILDEDE